MKYNYNNNIIGIDHGFRNMKTRNCIFDTAISQLPSKPDDMDGILEYQGGIYTIDGTRVSSVDTHNKAASEEYYNLTLAALAKELKARGNTKKAKVKLSAGLPQKWYFNQKDDFAEMLSRDRHLKFAFENEEYDIEIDGDVRIYIQGYAAALPLIAQKYKGQMVAIVDIGGETIDIILVNDKMKIMADDCKIDTRATIWLMNNMAERINSELYEVIHETKIMEYIVSADRTMPPRNSYEKIMQDSLKEYTLMVYQLLKKFRINTALTPVIFVGGGGCIMKQFGEQNQTMTEYITDLTANARGYEFLDDMYYTRK
jgi:plasmid segregation protein ParM